MSETDFRQANIALADRDFAEAGRLIERSQRLAIAAVAAEAEWPRA